MRKLFFTAAFAASLTISYAQDLKDVQEKIQKGKYDEAKEKLDKFIADPKNAKDPGGYYYQGVIQTYFAQTDSAGKLSYDASTEAFNAYKKALEIDPNNKYMMLDRNLGLFQLFDMNYNRGIKQYNNKNYDAAYSSFQKAVDVQDYLKSKNFSLQTYTPPALDTQLVNLTASAAFLAKKEDVAIPYFERLANAKISGPEYKEIYALIAQHYLTKNDAANANKYLAIGRELYEDEDYWLSLEFNTPELRNYEKEVTALRAQIEKSTGAEKTGLQKQMEVLHEKQRQAKLARYDAMMQKYTTNAPLSLDYAIELFNNTYVWETKPADYAARQAKLQTELDKAISLNPNSGLAWFIASQHYYSQVFDLEDARRAVSGNAPAAAAKRKDYTAQIDKKYEDVMNASQKAFDIYSAMTELKSQDKTNYRKVTDQLIDYYTRKKATDKVTFYQNKKAAIK